MATYKRLPVTFTHGEGAWLWDNNGKRYLDALSGIAVCSLGHAHPAIRDTLCRQAGKLIHTSNVYGIEHQAELGDKLTQLAGMDRVFFSNSGAEANEAAIKIARLYGHNRGIDTPTIIVMNNSFHGRTLATLSATGNPKIQAGFEPLVQGFIHLPYGDIDALKAVASNKNIVAVLVEPVQGEGGINIPATDYLPQIRALCDQHAWLMMLDEIQTGMGRTGKMFAFQHTDITPDVMTLAKALGNGLPIGACLARGEAADTFSPGSHGSTFGGNPLVCAAALTVIETIENEQLCQQAEKLSRRLVSGLSQAFANIDGVKEIRALGLMIGIELDRPCAELIGEALQQGLLINVTADHVIRLLPPLIMDEQQADLLIAELSRLVREFFND
ncbi:MAG: acetylornithine transaminase [Candidatus Polarisedimenticolaceae bacterium]|nr:acetylornithine transaminase [Candidatus Polarisedimenticolaceae bacterium]